MNLEKYFLTADASLTVFEFISTGPKGAIYKQIQFQPTHTAGLYNLAFGDKHSETGELNDLAVTNNGDTDKVLATVVAALYQFFDKHPGGLVYATGSTLARTRLYRMGITRFYADMQQDFTVFGLIGTELYPFEIDVAYEGFLAQRKF
jgi:hypothetical protein